jgi:hypothetical protein
MASSSQKPPLSLRWAAIGLAVVSFIWLPVEDTSVACILPLSAGWCALCGAWLYHRANQQLPAGPGGLLVIGLVSGLTVSPLAWLFALLKAGLHGHGFLDFTNNQLIFIAETTPGWMILGLLIAGLYWWLNFRDQAPKE